MDDDSKKIRILTQALAGGAVALLRKPFSEGLTRSR
jgi:hypothetical protein